MKNRPKYKVFITGVILASLLWVFNHLSNTFVVHDTMNINIVNSPITSINDTNVSVEITGKGFALVRYYFQKDEKVNVNFKSLKRKNNNEGTTYFLDKENMLRCAKKTLPENINIVNISTDTIIYQVPKQVVSISPPRK